MMSEIRATLSGRSVPYRPCQEVRDHSCRLTGGREHVSNRVVKTPLEAGRATTVVKVS